MRKNSFTLVELLIVIIIIGILATMAVPQYQKMVAKAKGAEAFIVLKTIMNAEELYYMEYNDYAGDLAKLTIDVPVSKYWRYSFRNRDVNAGVPGTDICYNADPISSTRSNPGVNVEGQYAGRVFSDKTRASGPFQFYKYTTSTSWQEITSP